MTEMYNGHPRTAYRYTGTDSDLFNRWKNGEVSTVDFQTWTAMGDGTASLILKSDTTTDPTEAHTTTDAAESDDYTLVFGAVLGVGLAAAMGWL